MGIMCSVMRGEFIESMHVAYAVAVDDSGEIIKNWGDPDYLTCVRSTLKPFQASTSVKNGATVAAGFDKAELALMCASHNGEEIHINTAQGMLDKLGIDETFYECGSHDPYHRESYEQLVKRSRSTSPLHNNCSGKHAGMLSLAKHLKSDLKGYTHVDHPVQQTIMKQVKQISGLDHFPLAVDGCSAPVPFIPLYNIALMYQKLASSENDELNILFDAMVSHPMLVAGTDRFDTDFISTMNGKAVTKIGGEAVRGISVRKGDSTIGVAIKMLDGSQRCLPTATLAILKDLKMIDDVELDKLDKYRNITRKNHRDLPIGSIKIGL